MIRIAINGLGRIGRAVMRLGLIRTDLSIVAINDLMGVDNIAYLLKYDSVHGRYNHDIRCRRDRLIIEDKEIRVFNRKNPLMLPWRRLDVDVVVEATGRFRSIRSVFLHRLAGAKKIVITANPQDKTNKAIPVIIKGVNENSYAGESIISAGSCSANCAGAITKILHENFVIQSGFVTAVHSYTRDQQLLDAGHPKDYRRGRAAACNIVPSQSDAAQVLSNIIPGLKDKIGGMTIRVPVPDGSLINFVLKVEKLTDRDTVNALIRKKAETELSDILNFCSEPMVSKDVINDTHSAVFDSFLTSVSSESMIRIVCWFDHEQGYAARVLDLVKIVSNKEV